EQCPGEAARDDPFRPVLAAPLAALASRLESAETKGADPDRCSHSRCAGRPSVTDVRGIARRRNATMTVKVRPLHDRAIVKRLAQEETSKGGIIIPDTAKEKPQEGQVVAVGPGRRDDYGKI